MESEFVFVLGIIFLVVGLPVICGSILSYHKQQNQFRDARGKDLDKEETEMLNELHKGLERMDKRIQALETILMEKRR